MILTVFGLFLIRLLYLQVFDEAYKQYAERNVLQKQIVQPFRGLIYDRNERLMVGNQTLYDLMVVPSSVSNPDTALLLDILDLSRDDFERRMQNAIDFSRFHPSVFVSQIDQEEAALIKERLYKLRGFHVQPRYARSYERPSGAQVFGYLSEAERRDIERDNTYYRMGDYLGVSGLERKYEEVLRGEKGLRHVMVDVMNRTQGSYLDGRMDVSAVPGDHIVSTIDAELQAYGERLMEGKIGSIVAIEPSTGDVLSMVSSPTYDPSMFVGRQRSRNFARMANDTTNPLFNRTVSAQYPPGSTIKPVMSLIGLQEGVVTAEERYFCRGAYVIPGLRVRCRDHNNPVNVHSSIQHSCNSFYSRLFRRIIDNPERGGAEDGYITFRHYMDSLNMLGPTGVDLPAEKGGIVPPASYYNFLYGEGRWGSSTILSLGIGQGEILSTPIQMAVQAAILANEGHYFEPRLVSEIITDEGRILMPKEQRETGFDSVHFETILTGMRDVIDNGTAWRARISDITWAGKTGTSQNPHGENHSLFLGYAPYDEPEIALAVVIENAGYGGAWAAPIASLMVEQYLKGETNRPRTERRILEQNFIIPEEKQIVHE